MILELLRELYGTYRRFAGNGVFIALFVVSAFALIYAYRIRQKGSAYILLSPFGTIGAAASEMIRAVSSSKYPRPAVKTAAVVFAVILATLTITSSGEYVFSDEVSSPSTNDMHMPEGLDMAADAILDDSSAPMVLTMPGWGTYLTAYSSNIRLMYEDPLGNDISRLGDDARSAYTELGRTHPDMKKIAQLAGKNGCTYVIVSDRMWPEFPLTYYGYEMIYDDGNCSVYKEVSAP